MVVTSEQIGAAEAAFEKLPLSKKLEAVGALARAERSAAANPYGFPLSSTGIPIVQGLNDDSVLG
eukprot:CAMPEP_0179006734 /NCGR_PEP_ID=MMETSP0795-20121207/14729_1 /TAXON_ID=88552 /ORGANISM="Amoebophrya sp., Strain Ameob2" /LENGTH=64 /DNA_ID=CAMNT_0020701549 /DNA_START=2136 /DNA_END=2326 /DNA_ORIENTATION=-